MFTIITRAKRLTGFGKGQIVALSLSGLNTPDIVKKIGKSKTIVKIFFYLNDNQGKRNFGGRPKALPSRGKQQF